MAINSLYSKIAAVSTAVGSLETDKRNTQQNYDYISADKVLDRVGSEMAKVSLVIIPALVAEQIDAIPWKQGHRYDCRVDIDMMIADGEGNTETVKWFGRGSDYSVPDKALYKAITSGHKYFLMKLFNIGVGNEDSEHDAPTKSNGLALEPDKTLKDNPTLRKQLHAVGTTLYADEWKSKRTDMSAAFEVESSNDWTEAQARRVIDGMNKRLVENGEQEALFEDKVES